ncbi:adaptin N terminal region-domain-containing protein [Hygrophoropsis aurantiaca]|uniref:Adaptin N terminal region-domain-containing protein n=1 Tax=Hygrophoropsis aurantiaca TaxID=72124 RepID=A0ACB8AFM5_9AGAM|nr:adaptin N terminal region-domain-containing protein [Hygrophoropsis aurantiaca]
MEALNLITFTQNASRLGMRIQESFSEHTRDLSITRGAGSLFDVPDDKVKNLGRQLDSSSDREKLDAMKRLIALISKGRNVSNYFPQVVKNVASQNLEIRKLVYIYLLRYAEHEPDLALLSINTFQKDLTDPSPLIRAMALRVLSGIKVPMIGSIVVLAIKKCAADISPYVRKAAALAIPKCFQLDPNHQPALIEIISTLLRDRSPLSIGSAIIAFETVCPTRLDLLHKQYRRLCRILVDVDEWGQVDLLNLLLRYARTMLLKPIMLSIREGSDEELDRDLNLLLSSGDPLFKSKNPSVVLAVVRVVYYTGPPSYLPKITAPLLRILNVSHAVERVVLGYLIAISKAYPHLFSPHYLRLIARTDDAQQVKRDKIRLLLNICTLENYQAILREFVEYAEDVDDQVVADSIGAIGQCASLIPACTHQCLSALMGMIKSKQDVIVSNAVLVLKSLVQNQLLSGTLAPASSSQSPIIIISQLARRIDDIRHPQAKACVLWLVGQYSPAQGGTVIDGIADWAPDLLRKAAKTFNQEDSIVKLQILNLAAKLFVLCPTDRSLGLLSRYVFSLCKYDMNYDIRDRTRMLAALLAGISPSINGDGPAEDQGGVVLRREQVLKVLFDGKVGISDDGSQTDDNNALIGSLSMITGKDMHGDSILPEWLESGIDPSLRDSEDDVVAAPVPVQAISSSRVVGSSNVTPTVLTPTGTSAPVRDVRESFRDLDKFYADDSDNSEESQSNSGDQNSDDNEEASIVMDSDKSEGGDDNDDDRDENAETDEDEDGDEDEDAEKETDGEHGHQTTG